MTFRQVLFIVGLVIVVAAGAWLGWRALHNGGQPMRATVATAAAAPIDTAGFARATGPHTLSFPADFGPHNAYQTEWWYYTGNLNASTGEHFGYQLTFFRRALLPPGQVVTRTSDWATDQVYMAHLALTDVAGGQHYNFERLGRGAAGLAGAVAQPYRVWLNDWSVADAADGLIKLQAADGSVALQLDMRDLKGPVLQGDAGYSRKGPELGNASFYYSQPRLATSGQITVSGRTYPVQGLSWMDHEYSTSALSQGQVGWDWFSVQLDNGREVMLFQIRRADGSRDPFSGGTLIEKDGSTHPIGQHQFTLQPTGRWLSPHSGATYPSGWNLSIPVADLELSLTPYVADQEMNVSYHYWEGAVRAQGQANGRPVTGSGYAELTGYAGSMGGAF
jgi:predicted secreted hydrolase